MKAPRHRPAAALGVIVERDRNDRAALRKRLSGRADEMERTAWLPPGSPELARAIRRVWALARELSPWRAPPGVHRFGSIEEANARREEWDRRSVALRKARPNPPER